MLAQAVHAANDPTQWLANWAIVALFVAMLWRLSQWVARAPASPDPWDDQVAADLEQDNATPLCHRCLLEHDESTHFCSNCGAPVGMGTNWLPFPYLFSIGHVMRIGTSGEFKRSTLTFTGYLLIGFVEYAMFAPVFWFVFIRKFFGFGVPTPDSPPPPGETSVSGPATSQDIPFQ